MHLANVAAFPNVDHPWLWVDAIERLAQLVTPATWAMHEHMHMRVPTRHVRVPDVELEKRFTKLPTRPCAEMGQKPVEVFRPCLWWRQGTGIGREGHKGVEGMLQLACAEAGPFEVAAIEMVQPVRVLPDISQLLHL